MKKIFLGSVVLAGLSAALAPFLVSAQSSDRVWVGLPVEKTLDAGERAAAGALVASIRVGGAIDRTRRLQCSQEVSTGNWSCWVEYRADGAAITDDQLWAAVIEKKITSPADLDPVEEARTDAPDMTLVEAFIQSVAPDKAVADFAEFYCQKEGAAIACKAWPHVRGTLSEWAAAWRAEQVTHTVGVVQ